jgi:hypothetical protein
MSESQLKKNIEVSSTHLPFTIYHLPFTIYRRGYSIEQETKERNTPPLEEQKIEIHPRN